MEGGYVTKGGGGGEGERLIKVKKDGSEILIFMYTLLRYLGRK